jgi:hypothetical protein
MYHRLRHLPSSSVHHSGYSQKTGDRDRKVGCFLDRERIDGEGDRESWMGGKDEDDRRDGRMNDE